MHPRQDQTSRPPRHGAEFQILPLHSRFTGQNWRTSWSSVYTCSPFCLLFSYPESLRQENALPSQAKDRWGGGGPRDNGRRKTGSWMGQLSAFTDQETEARRGEGNP